MGKTGALNEIEVMKLIDATLSQITDEAMRTRILKRAWFKYIKASTKLTDSGIPCKRQSKQATSVPVRIKTDFKKGEEE